MTSLKELRNTYRLCGVALLTRRSSHFQCCFAGGTRGGLRKNLQAINDFILFEQNFAMEKRIDVRLFCMLLDPVVGVEQLLRGVMWRVLQS